MTARMRAERHRVRLLSLALAACGLLAAAASAAPITNGADYSYTTSGSIQAAWPTVVTGDPIAFQGVSSNTGLVTPGSFSLGSFRVNSNSLAQLGPSADLKDTPFTVTMNFQAKDPSADLSSAKVVVNGMLNGSISGNNASSLTATITGVSGTGTVPFDVSKLTVLAPQMIAPGGVNGGVTALNAYLGSVGTTPQPPSIPEPTTMAVFGAVLALAGARHLRRAAATC